VVAGVVVAGVVVAGVVVAGVVVAGTATGCAAQQRRPPFVDHLFGLQAQGREWVSQQYFSSKKTNKDDIIGPG
jgi:hypothetical protein